jgi:hypothetical protein
MSHRKFSASDFTKGSRPTKPREILKPRIYIIDRLMIHNSFLDEGKQTPPTLPKVKPVWVGLELKVPSSKGHLVVSKCPANALDLPNRCKSSSRSVRLKAVTTTQLRTKPSHVNLSFSTLRESKEAQSPMKSLVMQSLTAGMKVSVTWKTATRKTRKNTIRV